MESIVFEFLVIFVDYLMGLYFAMNVLKEQFKLSITKVLIGAIITVFIYCFIDVAITNIPGNTFLPLINSTVTNIIFLFITYKLFSIVTNEEKGYLLFLMFISYNISVLYKGITLLGYSIFAPDLLISNYSVIDLIAFSIPGLILYPILTPIIKKYYLAWKELGVHADKKLWMIPFFFYILAVLQSNFYPADEYTLVNAAKICITLCAFLTYSQMFNAIINTSKAAKESEFKKQLQHQLHAEQARMKDLESYMEEIRRIQHDHRQHLNVLRGFLETNQKSDMIAYLDDYETSIQQNIKSPICEHRIADALCRRYEVLATQSQIKVTLDISLPQTVNINGSDLAVILGNLWENAIAAALDADKEHSFIHLWIKTYKDKIMIKMENGMGASIHFENDKFLSTKLNRDHKEGIGINSIKSITESYGGIADFSFTDQIFTASILLYMSVGD